MLNEIITVIPCLNEERHIERLVRYLLAEAAACPMRIVIADGGSRDRTPEIARALAAAHGSVHYLHNPARLQSAAVNLAVARYGQGAEYLIRLDAHADYPPGYCAALLDEARETGAASVVVAMETKAITAQRAARSEGVRGNFPRSFICFQRAVAAAQNSKLGNGGSAHRRVPSRGMWVDHGHHALMRIDAFTAVGGYDETFSHNEDAELDARLARAGYRLWLTAKTRLTYYPRTSPAGLFRQYRGYGEGRARNLLKHRGRPKLRQLLPAAVLPMMLLALAAPLSCLALLPLAAWALLCLGYGFFFAARKKDPALIASGPAAMIMHFAWSLGFWRGLKK